MATISSRAGSSTPTINTTSTTLPGTLPLDTYTSLLKLEAVGQLPRDQQDALNVFRDRKLIPSLPAFTEDDPWFKAASDRWGHDPALLPSIAEQESGLPDGTFDPIARSPRGVQGPGTGGVRGLMQVTGGTGANYGMNAQNIYNPYLQIETSAHYMRDLLDQNKGDLRAALHQYGNPAQVGYSNAVLDKMGKRQDRYATRGTAPSQNAPGAAGAPQGAPGEGEPSPDQGPPPLEVQQPVEPTPSQYATTSTPTTTTPAQIFAKRGGTGGMLGDLVPTILSMNPVLLALAHADPEGAKSVLGTILSSPVGRASHAAATVSELPGRAVGTALESTTGSKLAGDIGQGAVDWGPAAILGGKALLEGGQALYKTIPGVAKKIAKVEEYKAAEAAATRAEQSNILHRTITNEQAKVVTAAGDKAVAGAQHVGEVTHTALSQALEDIRNNIASQDPFAGGRGDTLIREMNRIDAMHPAAIRTLGHTGTGTAELDNYVRVLGGKNDAERALKLVEKAFNATNDLTRMTYLRRAQALSRVQIPGLEELEGHAADLEALQNFQVPTPKLPPGGPPEPPPTMGEAAARHIGKVAKYGAWLAGGSIFGRKMLQFLRRSGYIGHPGAE